ncbi:hypothetical protein K1T71_000342 [Dendrolimus kikuchii]|uniref:Uncharacterized protein n=1 Tax=Dendrolimus kikuchii TaxID=765133 RepID=A0ACC1DIV6_9NEOP|nr:hypothetical protein K1T71_000342 [Dendrolimus kikuchii]
MDWLKLFTFLIAVANGISAEVPMKKIRIHLPQKVKHIHHHKKIYITNHPASSQYAPAYVPGSEGAAAMPNNAILPADPNYTPFDSVEPYEDLPARQPLYAAPGSKMLPLYRARGYYGPPPSEWDEEQQYDVNTSAEPTDSFTSTGLASGPPAPLANYLPKKPKVVKAKEHPRKKVIPKNKTKQVFIRGKPVQEEEHPVSTFHEKFYSDLQGMGTIRKIKKPQRVEKIIDGDTEHIHTYSEEHIHKVVFDDGAKITGMPTDDSVNGIAVLPASRPIKPVKNPQSLLALPSNPFTGFAYGPMDTPADLEYAAYNPHEVTHDHIFHDHGEIPTGVDVTKNPLLYPPRVSYNSKGVRIGVGPIDNKLKYANSFKSTKTTPVTDFNYQENVPYQYTKAKNTYKNNNPYYDPSPQTLYNDFRPIPYFNFKEQGSLKSSSLVPSLYFDNERTQQTSVPTPFAVSSSIIHDYTPKSYSGRVTGSAGYTKFKDPMLNFKDSSYTSNLEYDTYAASSDYYPTAEKSDEFVPSFLGRKRKQKSVSRQNVNILGLDHNTSINHEDFDNGGFSSVSNNENSFTGFESNNEHEAKHPDAISSTPSNIKESSSAYSYYSAMAIKALHDEQQKQDLRQSSSTTPYTPPAGTKSLLTSEHYDVMNIDNISTLSPETDQKQRSKPKNTRVSNIHHDSIDYSGPFRPIGTSTKPSQISKYLHRQFGESSSSSSRLKYGDKLN